MENKQVKKNDRIMDSFIKKGWLFLLVVFLLPGFGVFAQTQDNMIKQDTTMKKHDTTKIRTKDVKLQKSTKTDTSRTYKLNQQNQNLDQQNQNQNQQNRNRYDNQKGDTLQKHHSHDAILIENNPRK